MKVQRVGLKGAILRILLVERTVNNNSRLAQLGCGDGEAPRGILRQRDMRRHLLVIHNV
jgi:hypothetical protein